jgi:pyruvate dehydrogenase E2 component (dihydrolipoamide acetyltransferase)
MATPVELPKSGNTVEECVIGRWVKQAGDAVSAGDVLAEVETDKATFEITAPVGGTLLATFFPEGALVPVFTTVCVIGGAEEDAEAFRPPAEAGTRKSGFGIRREPGRIPSPAPRIPTPEPRIPTAVPVSPRARKFAAERNFEPAAIIGSGPGGRVLEQDIRKAYESARAATPIARPASTREVIARRFREVATTAQYTLHASADAGQLLSMHARAKDMARARRTPEISINVLVTFCTIRALLETPDLNAELIDGAIVRQGAIHVGFACDTPRGLHVPVVRDAQDLSIGALARRMNELTAGAIDGTISPDALSGGTFTISNLESLGVEWITPVIIPPQVAVLGVGAIHAKPVRTGGGVDFIDAIALSLTCEHQAIDGASGARFLRALAEKIEHIEADTFLRGS